MPSAPPMHNPFQKNKKAYNWDQTRSTTQRGYGWNWQKLRVKILKRDNYLCQVCLQNNRLTKATQVDHITEKAQGGTDESANLQSICEPCHKHKTATGGGSKL